MNRAQEHKLKIKTSDLEAHYNTIKKDLEIMVDRQNKIVAERELEVTKLARLRKETEHEEKRRVKIVSETEQNLRKIEVELEKLHKGELTLELDTIDLKGEINDFSKYREEKENELLNIEQSINDSVLFLKDREMELNESIKIKEETLEDLESRNKDEGARNILETTRLMIEIEGLHSDLSEARKSILSALKEKDKIGIDIEKLLESKVTIFTNLEERERIVSDKESDLKVLERRIVKMYKRDYPDYKLNI